MAPKHYWFVRAGKKAERVDDFRSGSFVGIGWTEVGPVSESVSDEELAKRFKAKFPSERDNTRLVWASMVKRYVRDVHVGDGVMTYDPDKRVYLLGRIESGVEWLDEPLGRRRRVKWTHRVRRDDLSAQTRNSLGAIATFFRTNEEAAAEIAKLAVPLGAAIPDDQSQKGETPDPEAQILRAEVAEKADQFVEDRVAALSWQEMQELVAGILRAMGYRTQVAPEGGDRGVDIFASPDGLGLQEPRIFVEVKHRPGTTMGADEVRAFLGGRRGGDRCLYVSTGGFTKEAKYEADRAQVPLTLVTLAQLRELLLQYYEQLDPPTRALVPLQRLYWPAD